MAAVTGTLAGSTEFSGSYKVLKITYTPLTASDAMTLTTGTHGISEILYVQPKLTAGYDAALAGIFSAYSGLVITNVTTAAAGTGATDWTGATAELLVIGK